ncbi:hypothetical protein HKX48_003104 [Thoreauomyces humboldtii]|nr:hypothetical protein HKX48_003104 [Thoreauomyces humboldtii]
MGRILGLRGPPARILSGVPIDTDQTDGEQSDMSIESQQDFNLKDDDADENKESGHAGVQSNPQPVPALLMIPEEVQSEVSSVEADPSKQQRVSPTAESEICFSACMERSDTIRDSTTSSSAYVFNGRTGRATGICAWDATGSIPSGICRFTDAAYDTAADPANVSEHAYGNNWSSQPHLAQLQPTPKDKTNVTIDGVLYKKLELIGRGGSSKVYKIMSADKKVYAMKKVKLKGEDDSVIEGYLNEIALLRRLDKNDRIIRLFASELNQVEGHMLMVLEYGELDLAHILQKEQKAPVSRNFIRIYWEQMLRAVQAIHEENIIHSDLKPANFLLVQGALKLIDFGIAKSIPNDTTNIQRDHLTGTYNYMAPETIKPVDQGFAGESKPQYLKIGRASDVWSLGCILYQLVYGRPPFASLPIMKKLQCIVDPTYKINFPPSCEDQSLMQQLVACLDRDPRKRPTIPMLLGSDYFNPARRPGEENQGISTTTMAEIVRQVLALRGSAPPAGRIAQEIVDQLASGSRIDLARFRRPS